MNMNSLSAHRFPVKPVFWIHVRPRLQGSSKSITPLRLGLHATPRRSFVDICVPAHNLLEGLHNITSLPWAATISLSAGFVFGVVRAPINFYVHIIKQRQQDIIPELAEYRLQVQNLIKRKHANLPASERREKVRAAFARFCAGTRKLRGCQNWKLLAVYVKFPVWFMMMDTLRRMTGTERGFIGLIGFGSDNNARYSEPSYFADPSLAVEGMLWFPNLQVADPNLILPFMLSATLFMCARYGQGITPISLEPRVDLANEQAKDLNSSRLHKGRIRRRRMAEVAALSAGPLTLQFPSAMLLYCISSGLCKITSLFLTRRWSLITSPKATMVSRPVVKKQQYRGPRMQELRSSRKIPKGKTQTRHFQSLVAPSIR